MTPVVTQLPQSFDLPVYALCQGAVTDRRLFHTGDSELKKKNEKRSLSQGHITLTVSYNLVTFYRNRCSFLGRYVKSF